EEMAAHTHAARYSNNVARDRLVRRGDLHRACGREDSAPRVSQRATAKNGAGAALKDGDRIGARGAQRRSAERVPEKTARALGPGVDANRIRRRLDVGRHGGETRTGAPV